MTTAEFIAKTYNTTATRERRCSSVFTDYQGTVYSYGYHYPLAFRVAGLDFINEQGYSNTTAKHIAWARQALGYQYHGVKLWREDARVIADSYATDEQKLAVIKRALYREHASLIEQMANKKRKNTQVYEHLMNEAARVTNTIKELQ